MFTKKFTPVLSFLIIIAAVYYSFYVQKPSNEISKEIANSEFSVEIAMQHLKEISKEVHYTGSKNHAVVRNYIVSEIEKLGLDAQVQEQFSINKKWRAATNTKNIISRIKGSGNGKALLLLTHYDSSPHSSYGAADAGSGVVTILEGVRAFMASNKKPINDIIICISDAEELGLLGANAFVNNHPWAKDVGLVLNFEARGSGGPSYMLLETNGGNKKLIEAFHNSNATHPIGNSLMYSIYKMLPNDTDLTVFREDGNIDGFNFAFIGDHFDYHTAQDSYERMDVSSLKHQADYLMTGLNYFSNTDLTNLKAEEDFVFFDFPHYGTMYYPFSWVKILFFGCVVIFLLLLGIGFSRKKLTIKGIGRGFVPLILSLVTSGLLAHFGWKLALKSFSKYNDFLHGFTYNGYFFIAFIVAISLSISFWFYKGFFKKRTIQDLLIAPLLLWLIINGGISFYLEGASFFIIPVFVMLTILAVQVFVDNKSGTLMFYTTLMIPTLLIFSPMIKMLPVGLGLKMLFISAIFTVLMFTILIPVFQQVKFNSKLSKLFLLVAILALFKSFSMNSFTEDRKKPNSILYVLDDEKKEAFWGTYNHALDDFTKQFLGNNPIEGSYDKNTTTSKYATRIKYHQKAELKQIQNPLVNVLSDTVIGNNRKICLNVYSIRNANKIEIISKIPVKFKSFKVNETSLQKITENEYVFELQRGTVLSYYLTEENENIDIEFEVDITQNIDFDIYEAKYDLFTNPHFNIEPRTKKMMPMPFVLNDATVIKTKLKI